jgi:hypothetical protein
MSTTPTIEPLTDEQAQVFHDLTSGRFSNFALVSSALDGKPVAVIAAVHQVSDDEQFVEPLAILVDDDLFGRLTDPASVEV